MYYACAPLDAIIDSLIEFFDPTPFENVRDNQVLRDVLIAFRDVYWRSYLRFVTWITGWLNSILLYCGGCDCHYPDGVHASSPNQIECDMRGRRVQTAYTFANHKLQKGVVESETWSLNRWPAIVSSQG